MIFVTIINRPNYYGPDSYLMAGLVEELPELLAAVSTALYPPEGIAASDVSVNQQTFSCRGVYTPDDAFKVDIHEALSDELLRRTVANTIDVVLHSFLSPKLDRITPSPSVRVIVDYRSSYTYSW